MLPALQEYHDELETDKVIEPHQLDVECTRQPDVFFKWAERAVFARGEMERSKSAMSAIEARLQMECRREPELFGLKNATEGAVSAAVKCSDKFRKAQEAYYDAATISAWMDRAVDAMDVKRKMLDALVRLHGQEYFAGPSVPRSLEDAWRSYRKSSNEQVDGAMKQRARKRVRDEDRDDD